MNSNENVASQGGLTERITVPALDAMLGKTFSVLDHGYIRVIDYMGSDEAVVQAARVSYGKGTRSVTDDTALIRYLLRHFHTTPFEMCEIKLHIKLPIFVARQWIRHRTASVNEYSGRYSIIDNEYYVPPISSLAEQSSSNRQGRGQVIEGERASEIQAVIRESSEEAYAVYETLLGTDSLPGIARELARIGLGVNFYTQWYWKIDLHNLMNFLKLRVDRHAQFEIREYARVMLDIMKVWVPVTFKAFEDYRLNSTNLSVAAIDVIKQRLSGASVKFDESGMTQREWNELNELLKR